jgi:hypothetical protein
MAAAPYPETMIVVITAHGHIKVKTNPMTGLHEPEVFALPEGMSLTRISGVAPGVCNYSDAAFAGKIIDKVRFITSGIELTDENVPYLSESITTEIKKTTKSDAANMDKENELDEDEPAYLQDYKHHFDKICAKSSHGSCTLAINKIYSTDQLSSNYDDVILLLNVDEFGMDYFLTMDTPPPYRVSLETLLKDLKRDGVKNVILIDLSCAVFNDRGLQPSARDVRGLRRYIRDEKFGGKCTKCKTNKHKRKTNKHKRSKHKRIKHKRSKHKHKRKTNKRSKHKRSKHKRS